MIAEPPGTPPEPFVSFTAHAAANGFDFSTDERFGFVGDAFVACFGDAAPVTTLAGGHVDGVRRHPCRPGGSTEEAGSALTM